MKKGSFLAPSELCEPVKHKLLQQQAVKEAVGQNILANDDTPARVFVGRNSCIVNFVETGKVHQ